jgi:hypothetical protein
MRRRSPPDRIGLGIYACIAVFSFALPAVFAAGALSATDSIDQLYEKLKKEGGKLTIYAALSARSMEIILPAFLNDPGSDVGPHRRDRRSAACADCR